MPVDDCLPETPSDVTQVVQRQLELPWLQVTQSALMHMASATEQDDIFMLTIHFQNENIIHIT